MRVAIWHNLPSGGGKRALHDQVKGLIARGHKVEGWCTPLADRSFLPLSELISETVVPLPGWPEASPGAPTLRDALFRGRSLLRKFASLEEHAKLCAREISRRGFDVFLAHPCGFLRTNAVARFVDIPTVLYLQEPNRGLYEANSAHLLAAPERGTTAARRLTDFAQLQGWRLLAREEARNARAFGRLLVNSYYSRESVLRAYGRRVNPQVCYLGVDTDVFRPLDLARERFVVAVGTFNSAKNPELALRAIAALPREHRVPLVWLANETDEALHHSMMALAAELSVELEVRRRIAEREVVETLNRAAAMIYTPHLEPFGYAPLEANACGTPVVAVAEGGVRETVVDGVNGRLADADPGALAEALLPFLQDPTRTREIGTRAAEWVRAKWTLSASIDRLENHLRDAISGQRRSGGGG